MWKNIEQPGRPQMTIWRTHIACCVTKATNTHSKYVIFITFPPQQWLYERNTMLRYTTFPVLLHSTQAKFYNTY